MKDELDKIFNKLEKMDDRLGNIDVTLGKQEVSLTEHVRRTNLLEADLAPIKKHVWMVNGMFKLLGILSLLLGLLLGIKELI